MSNQKKTIKINPELFNITDKTKQNREKKSKPTSLVINSNSLKKQLLNRIKEHTSRMQYVSMKMKYQMSHYVSLY